MAAGCQQDRVTPTVLDAKGKMVVSPPQKSPRNISQGMNAASNARGDKAHNVKHTDRRPKSSNLTIGAATKALGHTIVEHSFHLFRPCGKFPWFKLGRKQPRVNPFDIWELMYPLDSNRDSEDSVTSQGPPELPGSSDTRDVYAQDNELNSGYTSKDTSPGRQQDSADANKGSQAVCGGSRNAHSRMKNTQISSAPSGRQLQAASKGKRVDVGSNGIRAHDARDDYKTPERSAIMRRKPYVLRPDDNDEVNGDRYAPVTSARTADQNGNIREGLPKHDMPNSHTPNTKPQVLQQGIMVLNSDRDVTAPVKTPSSGSMLCATPWKPSGTSVETSLPSTFLEDHRLPHGSKMDHTGGGKKRITESPARQTPAPCFAVKRKPTPYGRSYAPQKISATSQKTPMPLNVTDIHPVHQGRRPHHAIRAPNNTPIRPVELQASQDSSQDRRLAAVQKRRAHRMRAKSGAQSRLAAVPKGRLLGIEDGESSAIPGGLHIHSINAKVAPNPGGLSPTAPWTPSSPSSGVPTDPKPFNHKLTPSNEGISEIRNRMLDAWITSNTAFGLPRQASDMRSEDDEVGIQLRAPTPPRLMRNYSNERAARFNERALVSQHHVKRMNMRRQSSDSYAAIESPSLRAGAGNPRVNEEALAVQRRVHEENSAGLGDVNHQRLEVSETETETNAVLPNATTPANSIPQIYKMATGRAHVLPQAPALVSDHLGLPTGRPKTGLWRRRPSLDIHCNAGMATPNTNLTAGSPMSIGATSTEPSNGQLTSRESDVDDFAFEQWKRAQGGALAAFANLPTGIHPSLTSSSNEHILTKDQWPIFARAVLEGCTSSEPGFGIRDRRKENYENAGRFWDGFFCWFQPFWFCQL